MRQAINQGHTLMELAIVVSILGIVAVVAIPGISSNNSVKLNTATEELVTAARFARAEAIRTGTPHGINISTSGERIRVYSLPGTIPAYDVRHPVDKKLYDIQFDKDSRTAGVDISSADFNFDGGFNTSDLLSFNSDGIPKYSSLNTDYMLTAGSISLTHGKDQRLVSIAPMTGRVTVQ